MTPDATVQQPKDPKDDLSQWTDGRFAIVTVTAEPVGRADALSPFEGRLRAENLPEIKVTAVWDPEAERRRIEDRMLRVLGQDGVRVRDHRTGTGDVRVRDHRTVSDGSSVRVRDHRNTGGRTVPPPRGGRVPEPRGETGTGGGRIRDLTAKGPGPVRLDLLEGLRSDVPFEAGDLLSIQPALYQDANPQAGVYYYLPAAYHLRWQPDEGYGLRMLFGASTEPGRAGDVHVAARAASGVGLDEAALARELLEASRRRRRIAPIQLRPFPLAEPPRAALADSDDVTVHAVSDALGEIDLAWTTDPVRRAALELALTEDVGVPGVVTFTPQGAALEPVSIPLTIRLADAGTFGRWRFDDRRELRNAAPYPVRLRHLHALLLHEDQPIVYSWSLGDAVAPPGAAIRIQRSRIPRWIDERALRMWIDYGVEVDCEACDRKVIEELTSGVRGGAPEPAVFRTLTPLADTGAFEIEVTVRSRYLHPRERDLRTLPVLVLDQDRSTFEVGPLFPGSRQESAASPAPEGLEDREGPLLEYRLELLMPDGRSYTSETWLESRDLRIHVGTFQIEQALGFVPGQEPEEDEAS